MDNIYIKLPEQLERTLPKRVQEIRAFMMYEEANKLENEEARKNENE
jgi:hypothetical protein